MLPEITRFLEHVRAAPEFLAAAAKDEIWHARMDAVYDAFDAVYALGADGDVHSIETLDAARRVVTRPDLTIKQKLLAISKMGERLRVGPH